MKVIFLYIPKSDHGTQTERYAEELKKFYPEIEISLIDAESRDGVSISGLYDILQFPALVVVDQDMKLQKAWLGTMFPAMDQVKSYLV
jgi:hypothetical protein